MLVEVERSGEIECGVDAQLFCTKGEPTLGRAPVAGVIAEEFLELRQRRLKLLAWPRLDRLDDLVPASSLV
jgi:hypothetical protein